MKYEPLKRYLESLFQSGETRLSFAEIERILGFPLPRSACDHQAWWSNTRAGHSHAAAWLDAGWKTGGLDIAARRVSFIKVDNPLGGVAEEHAPFRHLDTRTIVLSPDVLSPRALRMIDDHVETHGGDRVKACATLLDQLAADRLAAMFDWFQKASRPATISSAELIREDRDSDER